MNYILQEYIKDRVSPEPMSGCWLWLLSDGNHGYPQGYANGTVVLAHRISYTAFKGEIPKGFDVDHICRNKPCVNPDHLEVVTPEENRRRQGLAVTHCIHGHKFDESNTLYRTANFRDKRRHLNGRKYRHCKTCQQGRNKARRA